MYILDGKVLQVNVAFVYGDIQYPANWLVLSTPEQRAVVGITEAEAQPRPDDRYYTVSDIQLDGTFISTPKNLDNVPQLDGNGQPVIIDGVPVMIIGLKAQKIAEVKATAFSKLSVSDWKVIRAAEGGPAVDASTVAFRAAVRSTSNTAEAAINAVATVPELITALNGIVWPTM